ncbi:1,4-dihydroxy-2-naphthoyl-CoA synthase [Tropheryma whipplei]|uniref:1,4-dihydroxy-2-naphthoyl-CoA synthase n=1 Tax=Tropheryma whipplei TaxID=2039 RepID=UPI0004BCC42F|nr:1,4-dihydroxy-2-naphthoyl-CoA synthase [Tropheryma whipplei]
MGESKGAPTFDTLQHVLLSELFDPDLWVAHEGFEACDVTYHTAPGVARIAFNRPEIRNAFRPETVDQLYAALDHARVSDKIGAVLLTGNGPSPRDGIRAFCAGGDQKTRRRDGYAYSDSHRSSRMHILEVQRLIRFMPKPVIALVNGWAAGGGHSLHVVCDLSIASLEHAKFKQTDATVASFDSGFGSAYFARQVGQKFAREVCFLAAEYDAKTALEKGAVNAVVEHEYLEQTGYEWARRILEQSPTSIRMFKYALNAVDDGLVGQQIFAGEATRLAYATDESKEGCDAFLEKRRPDWSSFPWSF